VTRFTLSTRSAIVMMVSAAAFMPFAYWAAAAIFLPNKDITFLALYRYGDIEYYPLIKALAAFNLKPTFDSAYAGDSMSQFPVGALFIHAVSLKIFGMYGFIVADAVIFAIFFFAVYRICLAVSPARPWLALATSIIAASFSLDIHTYLPLIGHYFYFYYLRIPRPFVSELWFFLFVGSLLEAKRGERPFPNSILVAVFLGVLAGLELQSNIYFFIVMGLLLGIMFVVDAVRFRTSFFRSVLAKYALLAAVALAVAVPFLIVLLNGNPALKVRFGIFPIRQRAEMLAWFVSNRVVVYGLIVAGVLSLLSLVGPLSRERAEFRLLALILFAAVAAPVMLMSLSPVEIQPDHHLEPVAQIRHLCVLAALYAVLDMALDRWQRARALFTPLFASCAVIVVVGVYCFVVGETVARTYEMRTDIASVPNAEQYRSDIARVMQSLDRSIGAGPSPPLRLLTNDYMLMTWWIMKGHGDLALVDAFDTVLPDAVLERKLIAAGKLLGWSTDEWIRTFLEPATAPGQLPKIVLFETLVSLLKYQASMFFTYAPLTDYPPEDRDLIKAEAISWRIVVPRSEIDRLRHAYDRGTVTMEPLPDIVVLTCYREWPCDRHPGLTGKSSVKLDTVEMICLKDSHYCETGVPTE
jgi:hypothetical protein